MFAAMMRAGRAGVLAGLVGAMLAGPAAAIVQGRDAPEFAPHAVMVLSDKGGFCTGVVVAPTAVMTAAHCVTGAAAWRVHYRAPSGDPVMLEPAAIARHPAYRAGAVKERARSIDLALVRLPTPLPAPFAPARLAPPQAGDAPRSFAGQELTVAGFGLAAEQDPRTGGRLRAATLGVVEPYGPSRILVWLANAVARSGACQGDSGGPIFAADGSVAALTVWAEGAGQKPGCGGLTQGLQIGPQRGWIDGVLRGWGL